MQRENELKDIRRSILFERKLPGVKGGKTKSTKIELNLLEKPNISIPEDFNFGDYQATVA